MAASCASPREEAADEFESRLAAQLPTEGSVDVDPEGDRIKVEDEAGAFERGLDLDLPAWVEPALTLPSDLRITTVLEVDQIKTLSATTARSPADIVAALRTSIAALGWDLDSATLDTATGTFLVEATSSDGQPIDIAMADTTFTLTIGRQRAAG